ncbi:flavin reductase family protein [Flavobacterium aciduliphilum]|uniref:Flavin reductase (DIM6/NTAB) family NADH-FMN oxidoreductase RutF n=1 Tax=Flavobacterium aciduliphilum TaxID=1101402 RepID=A0A328YKL6_9FLAO|nr:flavin reductase [Flavobacterium aciduliphilum]RAR70676.1 flavin reductase (DIM6/NTAB) family NADH-FMN oxidoreductase RutF [Flavobacterium aciduliphilum]
MTRHITSKELSEMDKQERVHVINSLGGFKSVVLVGTSCQKLKPNVAIFSSLFHIGANPPLVGLVFRPTPPERDTYSNILATGRYTINHINESIYRQAHQTSARYEKGISEFEMTGLTPTYLDDFSAPYVAESHLKFGIQFREKIDITINHTTLLIGEIIQIYIPETCLEKDGFINLEKANTLTCSGLDSYHRTIQLDRLSYAKPDKEITSLLKD